MDEVFNLPGRYVCFCGKSYNAHYERLLCGCEKSRDINKITYNDKSMQFEVHKAIIKMQSEKIKRILTLLEKAAIESDDLIIKQQKQVDAREMCGSCNHIDVEYQGYLRCLCDEGSKYVSLTDKCDKWELAK